MDNKSSVIPSIEFNGNAYENNVGKAEALNAYFISQSKLRDNAPALPRPILLPYPTLEMISISKQEVKEALRNLNVSKASGADFISPRVHKEVAAELWGPLSIFCKHLIQEGKFPLDYKVLNVVSIHKKGDRSLPTNFRPISLLSNTEKNYGTLYPQTCL